MKFFLKVSAVMAFWAIFPLLAALAFGLLSLH